MKAGVVYPPILPQRQTALFAKSVWSRYQL
jgi:hypothetical protein